MYLNGSSLTAILSGAPAATAPTYNASYRSGNANNSQGSLAATATTMVQAPVGDKTTYIDFLSIYNGDTSAATVTVTVVTGSTSTIMRVVTLAVGDTLQYVMGEGWTVQDTNGNTKTTAQTATTFSGGTGTNVIAMPDNLADGLSISQGSNAYLTFVTTDSSEAINVKKTLAFVGTTANNVVTMPDNLADGLNIKEGSNSYLKFITTDSSEAIVAGKPLRLGDVAALSAAGTVQGNAGAIIHQASFSTGDDTVGVVLPVAVAGDLRLVYNLAATAGLKVYPNTSGTINGGSANSSVTIEGKSLGLFYATNTVNWASIFTTNT